MDPATLVVPWGYGKPVSWIVVADVVNLTCRCSAIHLLHKAQVGDSGELPDVHTCAVCNWKRKLTLGRWNKLVNLNPRPSEVTL